jgi:hypothetical protein
VSKDVLQTLSEEGSKIGVLATWALREHPIMFKGNLKAWVGPLAPRTGHSAHLGVLLEDFKVGALEGFMAEVSPAVSATVVRVAAAEAAAKLSSTRDEEKDHLLILFFYL